MELKQSAWARQFAAALIANLSAFCIGNMLGWTSPMQPLLESEDTPVGDTPLTTEQVSWVGSINFVGAIIGTLFWGRLSDWLGRKKTGLLIGLPFTVAWIILLSANNLFWLIVGRIIVGVGCSGVIINMPMFVTEIAQDDIRGRLGSFLMFSLTAGTLFCFTIGSFAGYSGLTATCLIIPILFVILFSFLPESPVWLYVKGYHEEAEEALLWYRGGNRTCVEAELHRLAVRPVGQRSASISALWATKGTIKAMIISFGFVFGQQLCGILGISTFAVKIFQISGSSLTPYNSAIVLGCMQLAAAVLSTLLVDKAGRRILLIASFFTMGSALVLLGFYFLQVDSTLTWLPVTSLSFHVIAYSLGAGPVPFIVMAEIFSPEVRGTAMSMVQFAGTTLSFIGVKIFPTLITHFGTYGCFWFYGICSLITTVFVIFYVPETKGKPLSVILRKLEGEYSSKLQVNEPSPVFEKSSQTDEEKQGII